MPGDLHRGSADDLRTSGASLWRGGVQRELVRDLDLAWERRDVLGVWAEVGLAGRGLCQSRG